MCLWGGGGEGRGLGGAHPPHLPNSKVHTPQNLSLHIFFFFFFCFLGPHQQHMEVPRLGIESELQPLAYARATATPDPSHVCDLHHSSRQRQILNPLSEPRDQTHNLMVPTQIHFCCATTGIPLSPLSNLPPGLCIENFFQMLLKSNSYSCFKAQVQWPTSTSCLRCPQSESGESLASSAPCTSYLEAAVRNACLPDTQKQEARNRPRSSPDGRGWTQGSERRGLDPPCRLRAVEPASLTRVCSQGHRLPAQNRGQETPEAL